MSADIIQDWTNCRVAINGRSPRQYRYRVYRRGDRLYQDIHSMQGEPLHTLELPIGMRLEKNSYEVLLRYAVTDVIAA